MRAVRFDEYGDTSVLEVREVPDPVPAAGEVLVEVRAAGINPGETGIRNGALADRFPATFPSGQGSDLAGVVRAVGDGVDAVQVGDEVLGYSHQRSSHAKLVVVPADQVTPRPDGLSWEVAGGLFVAGTTAHALLDATGVTSDDVVVVSAAAGGVGSLTAQWARSRGARVIGLAGPDNADWLRERGVEPVDYHADPADLADRIRVVATPTVLLDTFGRPYAQLGMDLGIDPRRVVSVVPGSDPESVGARLVFHAETADADVLAEVARLVADGTLDLPVTTYPLEQVRAAFDALAGGHTRGKIVLVP